MEIRTPRQAAVQGEQHYPEYQSVVQDLQSRVLCYVQLLALADTSDSTEEWLKYKNLASEMERTDARLKAIPNLDDWVAKLADLYRSEVSQ